jgi:hypothetical protein
MQSNKWFSIIFSHHACIYSGFMLVILVCLNSRSTLVFWAAHLRHLLDVWLHLHSTLLPHLVSQSREPMQSML